MGQHQLKGEKPCLAKTTAGGSSSFSFSSFAAAAGMEDLTAATNSAVN